MLPAVSAAWHPWLAVLKNWRRKRYLQYNWGSEYSTAGPKKVGQAVLHYKLSSV